MSGVNVIELLEQLGKTEEIKKIIQRIKELFGETTIKDKKIEPLLYELGSIIRLSIMKSCRMIGHLLFFAQQPIDSFQD